MLTALFISTLKRWYSRRSTHPYVTTHVLLHLTSKLLLILYNLWLFMVFFMLHSSHHLFVVNVLVQHMTLLFRFYVTSIITFSNIDMAIVYLIFFELNCTVFLLEIRIFIHSIYYSLPNYYLSELNHLIPFIWSFCSLLHQLIILQYTLSDFVLQLTRVWKKNDDNNTNNIKNRQRYRNSLVQIRVKDYWIS